MWAVVYPPPELGVRTVRLDTAECKERCDDNWVHHCRRVVENKERETTQKHDYVNVGMRA